MNYSIRRSVKSVRIRVELGFNDLARDSMERLFFMGLVVGGMVLFL